MTTEQTSFLGKLNYKLGITILSISGSVIAGSFTVGVAITKVGTRIETRLENIENSITEHKILIDANAYSIGQRAGKDEFQRLQNRFDEHIENGTHYFRFKRDNQ